jgi:hypothetical protein
MQSFIKVGIVTVKSGWRAAVKAGDSKESLKAYARQRARNAEMTAGAFDTVAQDAKRWLAAKRPGGTDEQRAERKALRKERQARNAMSKKGKGASTNIKVTPDSSKKKGR